MISQASVPKRFDNLAVINFLASIPFTKKLTNFLLWHYSQVRNLYGFFSFEVTEEYPTMLATLQGFRMYHFLRLNAFPNTTNNLCEIKPLNFTTGPTLLSNRPRLRTRFNSVYTLPKNHDAICIVKNEKQ